MPPTLAQKPHPAPLTLEFADNALLPLLFGEHDRHLVRIEQGLNVRLSCRGNRVAISGERGDVERAAHTLNALYHRLEQGEMVGPAEVEATLRLAIPELAPRLPLGDLPAIRTRRGTIGPRGAGQLRYMELLASHEAVFAIGPAGTGKTFLAVAQAVAMLQKGMVDRIVLSRPAVEAGERLGFLPGDMREKVDPYLRPLYDALHEMMPAEQVARRLASGEIEVAPLAFMRGRTLSHAFAILDEAQNTTPMQMKMFLTRMGEGTRMVITGDPSQIDLPSGQKSGLLEALEVLRGVEGVAFAELTTADVARHPLVARIAAAYEAHSRRPGSARNEEGGRRRGGPAAGGEGREG